MKKILSFSLILVILISQIAFMSGCRKKTKFTDYSFDYFDTATTIIGYEKDEETFKSNCEKIKEQLEKYHKLYDIYYTYEGMNNLCSLNALTEGEHKELAVDQKIIDLLLYSIEMNELTGGYTNVALGSVLSIWHTYREEGLKNPAEAKLPPESELLEAIYNTELSTVKINEDDKTVHITDSKVSLDVGAIAKGYAVERVAKWMEVNDMNSYLLNVGGNIKTVGKRADKQKWSVGIENPNTDDKDNPYIEYLEIENLSVVTSGVYQRYYTVDGKNYHHIIDTDTLMPSEHFKSVTVVCENSALADALSTALMSMDLSQGKNLVDSLAGVEAMWVSNDFEKTYSENFSEYIA